MATVATRINAAEYYELTVEGDHKQLVEGEIVVTETKLLHGLLQNRLVVAISAWTAEGEKRGQVFPPTDVRMNEWNVFGPDLVWISSANLPSDLDTYPERVPEICVEIRSESTWRYDIGAKKRVYESGGLPELWLVDSAAETVLVYRRSTPESPDFDIAVELTRSETLTSPQLPDFAVSVDELFAWPPE